MSEPDSIRDYTVEWIANIITIFIKSAVAMWLYSLFKEFDVGSTHYPEITFWQWAVIATALDVFFPAKRKEG